MHIQSVSKIRSNVGVYITSNGEYFEGDKINFDKYISCVLLTQFLFIPHRSITN